MRQNHLTFDLPIKNYDDLRTEGSVVPMILIVTRVPRDAAQWIVQSEESLAMHHCAYWVSLRGAGPVTNTASVRVQLPRENVFGVSALQAIMQAINDGIWP